MPELEAGAAAAFGLKLPYAVFQASDGAHQRHRAVFHGVHLGESAGFVAGGHEQNIAAGQNLVGQGFVEADGHTGAGVAAETAEIFFVEGSALA